MLILNFKTCELLHGTFQTGKKLRTPCFLELGTKQKCNFRTPDPESQAIPKLLG